ncbi:MAG: tetratricopeptide repeat protein [Balneolaceae bacterium]
MSKHHTKEELEHDPLVEFIGKTVTFFNANKTTVLSVGITLIVVVSVIFGYSFYSSSQEGKAQQLLSQAENFYSEGDYTKALNGDEASYSFGFIEIADNYANTNSGNIAIYYASVSSYKLGNYEDALAYIKKYKHVKGILGVGSLSFEASLYELNEDFDKAASTYEKAANWDVNNSTTPFNLYKAANAYHKAGKNDKAKQIAAKIIADYPNSPEMAESQRLQGLLAVSN